MDLEDQVPVLVLDILEADVSQDSGIVDEDIDTTKCLDRGLDNLVSVLYGVVVCDSLSAGLLYLVDDYICSLVGVQSQLRAQNDTHWASTSWQ